MRVCGIKIIDYTFNRPTHKSVCRILVHGTQTQESCATVESATHNLSGSSSFSVNVENPLTQTEAKGNAWSMGQCDECCLKQATIEKKLVDCNIICLLYNSVKWTAPAQESWFGSHFAVVLN